MKKLMLSAILAMGLASTAMANGITVQGEYHDLSGSAYDKIKVYGAKANYDKFGLFVKKWTKSGDDVSDIDGTQIFGGMKTALSDGFTGNFGIEFVKVKVDDGDTSDNWVYNLGVSKVLDEETSLNAQAWYTAVDNEKNNQQLDLTINTKLDEEVGLKAKAGITILHNGELDKNYAVFSAGISKQCNDKLTGKLAVTLGKNSGMIYANGWLIEGKDVEYKVNAEANYKIDKQNSVGLNIGYTSYEDDIHKTSYIVNYTYRF